MSLYTTVGQFHIPSDQQQTETSSLPSSSSPISTTNIFHVYTRQLFLRHSPAPLSSPINQSRHQSTRQTICPLTYRCVHTSIRQPSSSPPPPRHACRRYRSLCVCPGSIFQPTRHF